MSQLILRSVFSCFSMASILWLQSGESQAPPPCQFKEVMNRKGWAVPGLSKTVTKLSHARYVSDGTENVFVDMLESEAPEGWVTSVSVVPNLSTRLEITNRPVDVTQIQRFTIHDHVFGYLVTAVYVGIDETGRRTRTGSEEMLYYYDPDGAGKFTVMRYAGQMFFKIVIPDWAKQPTKTP